MPVTGPRWAIKPVNHGGPCPAPHALNIPDRHQLATSWPVGRCHRQPVIAPTTAPAGPLAVATGHRAAGRAARRYCPCSAARGPWLGAPPYRVKNRRNPPKNRDFRAAARALADAS